MNTQELSFNQFYTKYQKQFICFANSYVRDSWVAEDIIAEALMCYWENRDQIDAKTNVPAYVLTIVKNKCLNYLRHIQIKEDLSDKMMAYQEWELNSRISSLQACEPTEVLTKEIHELVNKTLNKMPDRTREIFVMNRFENKTYAEIATIMNISKKGVDFHICKALKVLQENLKDYFPLFLIYF